MPTRNPAELIDDASRWWASSITAIEPGRIAMRGYPIEELIGTIGFVDMMWLLLRGDLPTKEQAWLLEATLVASVDHGSVALSASTARMAVTRGLPVNGALASAINVLDDVHGGPAEQCMELYLEIAREAGDDVEPVRAVGVVLQHWRERGGKFLPGFGHRFHPLDPRTPKILKQVDSIAGSGAISGRFACIGRTVERALSLGKAKPIPMRAGLRAGARAQPVHSEPRPGLAGARWE